MRIVIVRWHMEFDLKILSLYNLVQLVNTIVPSYDYDIEIMICGYPVFVDPLN